MPLRRLVKSQMIIIFPLLAVTPRRVKEQERNKETKIHISQDPG